MWIMLTMDCWLSAVISVIWKSRNRAVNAPDNNNTATQRDFRTHALRETIETYVGEKVTSVSTEDRKHHIVHNRRLPPVHRPEIPTIGNVTHRKQAVHVNYSSAEMILVRGWRGKPNGRRCPLGPWWNFLEDKAGLFFWDSTNVDY
jgi:hypothetical protein